MKKTKTKCRGAYAKTLRLTDRYFFCESCRECKLSEQLPDWNPEAEWEDIVEKINGLYPYKVKVMVGNEPRSTIKQYSTINEMIEDVCGTSYVAGLNDCGCVIKFLE